MRLFVVGERPSFRRVARISGRDGRVQHVRWYLREENELCRVKGLGGYTAVFEGLGKTSGPGAVVRLRYIVAVNDQRSSKKMFPLAEAPIRCSCVHACKTALHVIVGKHADVLNPQWLENVLLEIVVQ